MRENVARLFLPLCKIEICDFVFFCSVKKRESSKTMTSVSFTESNVTDSSLFGPERCFPDIPRVSLSAVLEPTKKSTE